MSAPSSNVSFAARDYTAGKKIAGCYALESLLYETPFAVVWSAQDDLLGRKVALYFLPDSVASDAKVLNEVREQVRLNRQILHPGIVRVYDLVEDVDCAAVSMDLVDARPLAEVQRQKDGKVFHPAETQKWFGQLTRTGTEAHDAHLIHRDLSPDTVLVRADGELVISAFGISRTVLDALARQQPNRPDPHLPYLSPQLLDGEAPSPTDDIYSFGALMFTLLTGNPPFYQNEIIAQIRKAVPPSLGARRQERKIAGEKIPANWEKAAAACLAKHLDARPKTFKEVAQLMGLSGAALTPPPPAAPAPAPAAQGAKAKTETAAASGAALAASAVSGAESKPAETPAEKKATPPAKQGRQDAVPPSESKPARQTERPPVKEEKAPAREKTVAAGVPATSRVSPFSPFPREKSAREEYMPRKRGGGIGIAAGLGIFALVLIGLIYLVSRQSVETVTATTPKGLGTAMSGASPGGSPVPERPVVTLPSPAPEPEPEPTASPALAAASPTATPSPTPAEQALELTPVKDPGALTAEALADAIEKADSLFKELTDQQASLQETVETTRQAAEAGTEKLPEARKELEGMEAAVKAEQEAEAKAAAAAEEARKAAEGKQAELTAAQKKVEEKQSAVTQQQKTIEEAEKELEAAAAKAKEAEAELEKVKEKVTGARAERKRLTDARSQLAARDAETEAARQQQLEADRKAAAELAAKDEEERATLAREAAEAEQAAAEAAALAEQARQALEKAERLRKASDEARERVNARTQGAPATTPATSTPSPSPSPVGAAADAPEAEPLPSGGAGVTNSIGMRFTQVGDVLFSIWPTRLQDYTQFAQATGRNEGRWKDPGFEQGPDHPVVYVTWMDAIAFCQWLTEKEQASGALPTNRTYRLPTDLEWSAAVGLPTEEGDTPEARDMGIANVFPWGNTWPPPVNAGNYTGEETGSDVAIKGFKDGFVYTSPVGRFTPTATGLYDMGGNVWEWCMDWWNSQQTSKVLRGASWYNGALKLSLLSSCRVRATPDSSTDNYGFRIVSSAIPKATALQ